MRHVFFRAGFHFRKSWSFDEGRRSFARVDSREATNVTCQDGRLKFFNQFLKSNLSDFLYIIRNVCKSSTLGNWI
ncbi:MAG: DUF3822 family protein [Deltaproteobacteria bacterium]|nr:DUF3822 family protein [Deltaproteobacteria bacterium]